MWESVLVLKPGAVQARTRKAIESLRSLVADFPRTHQAAAEMDFIGLVEKIRAKYRQICSGLPGEMPNVCLLDCPCITQPPPKLSTNLCRCSYHRSQEVAIRVSVFDWMAARAAPVVVHHRCCDCSNTNRLKLMMFRQCPKKTHPRRACPVAARFYCRRSRVGTPLSQHIFVGTLSC